MKHSVPAELFDKLDGWLRGPWTKDVPSDDSLYDAEVEFKNGIRLLIQVVGCYQETPYVQVVALDKDGNEIGCNCDTSDTGLGGRYQVGVECLNGSTKQYIVDVVRGRPKAKKKERKKTMKLSTIQRLAFCNSQQLPHRIVQDGVVKEWVGVGWISTGDKPKPTDVYVVED